MNLPNFPKGEEMQIREVEVLYKASNVPLEQGESYRGSRQVFEGFRHLWLQPVETFTVICLDGKNRMLHWEQVAKGTLTAALAHPREIFFTAVKVRAAGIICVHNHPSGDPGASQEDMEITRRLMEPGKIIGIRLLDHLIIGEESYFSFRDQGLL